jgi:hypothetical protein
MDCCLEIGNESFFISDAATGKVVRDIAFQEVLCWGYDQKSVELRLFGRTFGLEGKTVDLLLVTSDGAALAVQLFETVKKLKRAIESGSLSQADFDTLLMVLREDSTRERQRELEVLRQFGAGQKLQGSQVR